MSDPRLPFFLYGTLLPGERNHPLLLSRAASWTPALLPGALLFDGPGFPYAVPAPAGRPDAPCSGVVHGRLMEVPARTYDGVLADLDRLEGFGGRPADPANLFDRCRVTVSRERGTTEAWVYFAPPHTARDLLVSGRRIADGRWPHTPSRAE